MTDIRICGHKTAYEILDHARKFAEEYVVDDCSMSLAAFASALGYMANKQIYDEGYDQIGPQMPEGTSSDEIGRLAQHGAVALMKEMDKAIFKASEGWCEVQDAKDEGLN